MAETQLQRIMSGLGCSKEEAEEIMRCDKEIDRGKKMDFDLSPEKEKIAKQFSRTGTRKTPPAYSFTERKTKANPTKEGVIEDVAKFLEENGYNSVEILNKTRLIGFKIGEDAYELTLVAKRKKKN